MCISVFLTCSINLNLTGYSVGRGHDPADQVPVFDRGAFFGIARKKLRLSHTPDNAAGEYTWTSSDAKSATVNEDGEVTGLVAGKTVTITCTAADGSGKKATVKFKILAAE